MALRRKDGSWQVVRLPSGDWHPEEIKAAVRMSRPRMTLQKLAAEAGLNINACGAALSRPHYLGELAIADLLGLHPSDIWPSRYEADGTRICRIRTKTADKVSHETEFRLCENRVAA